MQQCNVLPFPLPSQTEGNTLCNIFLHQSGATCTGPRTPWKLQRQERDGYDINSQKNNESKYSG